MNVPQGQSIPVGQLQQAAQAGGTLAKRANFALTMRRLNKG
jgi:hypothetical protein